MKAVVLLFSVVLHSSVTTKVTGYMCYKCDNVALPDLCANIAECGPHESCFVDRFTSDRGSIFYTSGCREILNNMTCVIGNRKRTSFPDCSECCTTDYCNKHLCTSTPMKSLTRCLQCSGVFSPKDCTKVTTCSHDQSCYTQEVDQFGYQVYNLGCQPKTSCLSEPIFGRRQLKQTRSEKCHECCDGENCNRHLCVTRKTTITTPIPSTTTPTTTTTTLPPIKRDCEELYQSNIRHSGVYRISPDNIHFIDVYCDMDNYGGWIVLIRRTNAILNFTRGWNDYVTGFGDFNTDFWLGLDNIHLLTNPGVDVMFEGVTKDTSENVWMKYHNFIVDGAGTNYTMHVNPNGTYSTVASRLNYDTENGFGYHNGGQFSSNIDRNHVSSCANQYGGSWWHIDCWEVLITNDYNKMNLKASYQEGDVTNVKMKIRRTSI